MREQEIKSMRCREEEREKARDKVKDRGTINHTFKDII
jgi:hypothetical protein